MCPEYANNIPQEDFNQEAISQMDPLDEAYLLLEQLIETPELHDKWEETINEGSAQEGLDKIKAF